jgi:hypothetical protein
MLTTLTSPDAYLVSARLEALTSKAFLKRLRKIDGGRHFIFRLSVTVQIQRPPGLCKGFGYEKYSFAVLLMTFLSAYVAFQVLDVAFLDPKLSARSII